MIKVLVFDADGVLIHGQRFSEKLAKEYGITIEQTKPFFSGPFEQCLIGNLDLKEAVSPYLEDWGWKTGVDSFLDYWFNTEHILNQELIDCIQEFRKNGIACVVATNQEKMRAEHFLKKLGFSESFDNLYASAHLGSKKPHTNFYANLMKNFDGVNKEEVLFWDDDIKNIEGAKEFGINAELYTTFSDFKEKIKDYL